MVIQEGSNRRLKSNNQYTFQYIPNALVQVILEGDLPVYSGRIDPRDQSRVEEILSAIFELWALVIPSVQVTIHPGQFAGREANFDKRLPGR